MPDLTALIFDVDGTIADTERDGHRVAFNKAFEEAGLGWHWTVPLYGRLLRIAGGRERLRYYMEHHAGQPRPAADPEALITQLHTAKNRYYAELLARNGITARPGVKRLLLEARNEGVRLGIATTGVRDNVRALLERVLDPAAPGWFEVIATADEVAEKKPSPCVYEYVISRLDIKADQCLAIEDSENGLKAAQAAQLKTIVTVNPYTRDGDLAAAMLILDHLGGPEQPFTILGGRLANKLNATASYADMALLKTVHALGRG